VPNYERGNNSAPAPNYERGNDSTGGGEGDYSKAPVPAARVTTGHLCQREATLEDHLEYVQYYKNKQLEPGTAPGTAWVIEGEDDTSTYPALMSDSVPNNLRWYVVTVGVQPGVHQGW
jgi:hypothetical protein